MNTTFLFIAIGITLGLYFGYNKLNRAKTSPQRMPQRPFPQAWRDLLVQKVEFYNRLSPQKKTEFENRVHIFLLNVHITGVDTEVTHLDRILVASGAIIPIFGFESWHYANLQEVILYPDKFQIPTTSKFATGLVGWGAMEGTMMLSKKAMIEGFHDQSDNQNVVIHEFIHILDKQDGKVDGVLGKVMDEIDIQPWLNIIHQKMREIQQGNSTIRNYGKANNAEFLAVVSEFFFENPDRMKSEHPALYKALDRFYNPKVYPKRTIVQRMKRAGGYNKSER